MQTNSRIALLVGGSLLIGGCQLFQGNTARLEAGLRIPRQAEPRDYAREQFAAGRAELTAHNYASAIAAFRNSSLEPELAAPSYNGLGVAYAGIGRNDLAERYFRMAIADDPGSPRYASNLARLEQANRDRDQVRLAQEQRQQDEAQARALRILPGSRARARLEVTTPSTRVTHRSGAAVEIGGSPEPAVQPAARAALPEVAARSGLDATGPAAMGDTPTGPHLRVSRAGATLTTLAPESRRAGVKAVRTPRVAASEPIRTTGRRYSPRQFAEIFAPYDRSEGQVPIMASVTSPGLRSAAPVHLETGPALPHPQFGTALADAAEVGPAMAAQ